MKKNILFFIMGAIIFGSIGVFATLSYEASQITYKNTTLDHAIDDLYTTQNNAVNTLQNQLNSEINKPLQIRFAFLSGNSGMMRITPFANNYNYYNVELEGKGSSATCAVEAVDSSNKFYDISFNQDYSITYNDSNDLRVQFSATNGWCTFRLNFHN